MATNTFIGPESRVDGSTSYYYEFTYKNNTYTQEITYPKGTPTPPPTTKVYEGGLGNNKRPSTSTVVVTYGGTRTSSQPGATYTTSEKIKLTNEIVDLTKNNFNSSNLQTNIDLNPTQTGESTAETDTLDVKDFGENITNFNPGSEYQSEFLIYPSSIKPTSQDRIVIVQKQYKVSDTNLNSIFGGQSSTAQEKILGTAVLPMPNNITESNVTGWGENSLSTLAGTVMGLAYKGASKFASGDMSGLVGPSEESLKNEVTTVLGNQEVQSRIKTALTLNAAAQITKFLGINVDPEAFRSRATGTVINPNLELLFNGPKLRSFGFEFKMSPRDEGEAKNIRYIIKFFKKGMAPIKKLTTGEDSGFYLGAPNVFDIQFKPGDNKSELQSIGKIKTCALQQCNVNYTPEGFYAAYQDSQAGGSQPISVTMQLAFSELTPLYNDDYSSDVGNIN